jgi:hypothetical protein
VVGTGQESHHFVQRWNVELRHGADLLQPFPHGLTRIEQFESNFVVLCPSLQKYEHAKTATFNGIHFGEVKHDRSCVCLQGDSFAQFEGSFALHNSAFALYDGQVTNVLYIYSQHHFLQLQSLLRARTVPTLYFVLVEVALSAVMLEVSAKSEQICPTGKAVFLLRNYLHDQLVPKVKCAAKV